jgi:hypothetical protein
MKTIGYALVGLAALAGIHGGGAAQTALTSPQGSNGLLGGSDPRDSSGSYYDDYRFRIEAGQRIRASASRPGGSQLDPVLEVYAPGQSQPIAVNDDGGGFPNALLEFVAPRSGTYVVRVRSYGSSTGAYDFRIEPLTQLSATLSLGAVNNGRFDNSVPRNGQVHYIDYEVQLRAGQDIVLRMNADSFDSVIQVFSAGSEGGSPLAVNDDFGGTLNSALLFRAPRDGTYIVRATQLSHGDGPFVLRSTILP